MSSDSNSLSEHIASDSAVRDRLRILDLLIWTACIAACLTWFRFALDFRGVDWSTGGTNAVEWGLHAVVGGTAITAIFVVGPRLRRRQALTPGEWLWILLGVEAAAGILLDATQMAVESVMAGGAIVHSGKYWAIALVILHGALAVAALMIFRSIASARWQTVFAFLALVFLIELSAYALVVMFYSGVYDAGPFFLQPYTHINNGTLRLFPAAAILFALWADCRFHRTYPWRHWVGGFVFLAALVRTASFLLGWP